nr:hypothetical protein Iba_chr01bCG15780 [Ipomoea batatas]
MPSCVFSFIVPYLYNLATREPQAAVSETLGEGKTENVSIILSGYSSLIFEIKRVPMPDPVPPPTSLRTTSRTASINSAPSVLEIHKHRTGDIPAAGSLIEIDVDALELEVINGGVAAVAALVAAGRINAVLVADNFPELGANLVAALASLNVQDLSHDSLLLLSLPLDSFASMFVGRCNE